ncbi:MAG: recombinase family protein [Streptosporangiaceae bacterium]
MARIGYARTSTRDQVADAQTDALVATGCSRVFTDKGVSGKLARRPQLDACLESLRQGDTLVVTKLDRLGRSLGDLIELVTSLGHRGVDVVVIDQGIDTTTAAGKLLFHVLGAVAEFEQDLISERTKDGLAAASARGRRRPKLTDTQAQLARQLYASREYTVAKIAAMLGGVSRATVYRCLNLPPTRRKGSWAATGRRAARPAG